MLWGMKRNPAHCGSQYQIPFPSLLSHQSDRWREYVAKDFSSEAAGDGGPRSFKTISGASKTEKLGQKAVSIDSGVEYKHETRTPSSGLYLIHYTVLEELIPFISSSGQCLNCLHRLGN